MKKGKSRNKRKKTRSRLLWIAIAVIGIAAVISAVCVAGMLATKENAWKTPEELLVEYMDHIPKQEYEEMYAMLHIEASGNVSQEDFVTRNSAIYEGIEVQNIAVQIIAYDEEQMTVTYQTSFDTVAGTISFRKLRKERHRFQQGDLELKNAVTNISHDLRTPLTAISGYLDLLDNAEKSEEAERYIKVIRNRTEVLRQLTEELFCYSVVTSPEYDNDVEFVSVNSVLEESILGFYAVLQERNITPNISMPENKVFRKVNRAALSRIFSNLLNNAIKYSDGDLNITLNDTGEITFSNTASDLSEVDVKKLFDRFYTVENARKSTGLGLSISRILIEQMKGTISAQYKNGKLSICIWLPDVSGD